MRRFISCNQVINLFKGEAGNDYSEDGEENRNAVDEDNVEGDGEDNDKGDGKGGDGGKKRNAELFIDALLNLFNDTETVEVV